MFSRFEKFLIAFVTSMLFAGVTLVAVSAQDGTPPPTQEENSNCADCHENVQMSWQNGPHGHATDDPIFVKAWTDQGKPSACLTCHVTGYDEATGTWKADGVTCAACHSDKGGQHPKTTMSVDGSPNTCGTCHTDTRFGLKDWEGSAHFQAGMECSSCHDPHNASLKITVNLKDQNSKDASRLCISCHEEASMNFPYSIHAKQGVTCIDCHLEHLEDTNTDIHKMADHSFKASVQTCATCHADQMHADGEAIATEQIANISVANTAEPTHALEMSSITPEPKPVSPFGYAGLAALIGVGAGMLLAPNLERWYRMVVKKSNEVDHDGK
ncbi:MAG: ammonia-forming cytochrome c nitrite reductase subunit c552 [Anaerolineales bacterium]|nr:ammonia-forming cytochrome c nitrite reductase subunit c552 [Anaerolineales bacterium]